MDEGRDNGQHLNLGGWIALREEAKVGGEFKGYQSY